MYQIRDGILYWTNGFGEITQSIKLGPWKDFDEMRAVIREAQVQLANQRLKKTEND